MSASLQNDGEELISEENLAYRSDADMSSSDKIPVAATDDTAANRALSADYAQIAKLFAQLDQQVGAFTSNMDAVIQQAPAMDGLTTLWTEQAKTASADATPTTLGAQKEDDADTDNDTAMLLGDEAENINDPLIFL
jgi:hypothetical protein